MGCCRWARDRTISVCTNHISCEYVYVCAYLRYANVLQRGVTAEPSKSVVFLRSPLEPIMY